jgi:hypothetical protein
MKQNLKTIRVIVDIDADGDVFVMDKKDVFHYVGMLVGEKDKVITMDGEIISSQVPNRGYLEAKKKGKIITN